MSTRKVIRCYFKTFSDFVSTYAANSGTGGIFVQTPDAVSEGESVRFEFKLRNDYPLITGNGTVSQPQPGSGFTLVFGDMDADSEKFLNEVVKVKAGQIEGAAEVAEFETQITEEEGAEAMDGFDEIDPVEDIEEVEEVEEVETGDFVKPVEEAAADPFGEWGGDAASVDEPAAAGEADAFSDFETADMTASDDLSEPSAPPLIDDFESPGDAPDPDVMMTGDESYEDDDFEDVDQTPSDPSTLFDDDIDDAGHAAAAVPPMGAEAGAVEASSDVTEISVKAGKSKKPLLIAAVAVLVLAIAGGGAWFFLGGGGGGIADSTPPPVNLAAINDQPPALEPAAPVSGATEAATAPAAATAEVAAEPSVEEPVAAQAPVEAPATPEPVAAAPKLKPKPKPVAAKKPVRSVAKLRPATKVTGISSIDDRTVIIQADGAIGKYKYFGMRKPNRVVVDVYGVQKGFKGSKLAGQGNIARIRPGIHKTKVRVVFDLARGSGTMPAYDVVQNGDQIQVIVR